MVITDLLESLASVALLLVLAIGALFTRRVVIRRRGGTFDCSLRLTPGSARAAVHYGAGAGADSPHDLRGATTGPGHSHGHGTLGAAEHPNPAPSSYQPQSPDRVPEFPQPVLGTGTTRPGGPGIPAPPPPTKRGTRTPFSAAGVRAGRGWSYGIAQYENDRIDWYRIFSYAYRPAAVLTRRDLDVIGRRDAEGHEELALFSGWTIVECRFGTGLVELAMSPDALTGFLSWIEGAPPGQNVSRVS